MEIDKRSEKKETHEKEDRVKKGGDKLLHFFQMVGEPNTPASNRRECIWRSKEKKIRTGGP